MNGRVARTLFGVTVHFLLRSTKGQEEQFSMTVRHSDFHPLMAWLGAGWVV